jgi:hypothetical protein
MWQGLQAQTAEVTDDFLETFETARRKFKMQQLELEVSGPASSVNILSLMPSLSTGLAREQELVQAHKI